MAAACLLLLASAALGQGIAAKPGTVFRLCLPDFAVPPGLLNDPKRLGPGEQLLVDAGREAGLEVAILRAPNRRCLVMVASGETDGAVGSPVPANLQACVYPMRGAAVDTSRSAARLSLVVVRQRSSPYGWDGKRFSGPGNPVVGTRIAFNSAITPLQALGLTVNSQAQNSEQLLRMLAAGRFDLAVALKEEVDLSAIASMGERLEVLEAPFLVLDFYMCVSPKLASERPETVQAFWDAISRLRDRRGGAGR